MIRLNPEERDIAAAAAGPGPAMAMRIVAETARIMGAPHLVPVVSAHVE